MLEQEADLELQADGLILILDHSSHHAPTSFGFSLGPGSIIVRVSRLTDCSCIDEVEVQRGWSLFPSPRWADVAVQRLTPSSSRQVVSPKDGDQQL
jgi:hypothetical protein